MNRKELQQYIQNVYGVEPDYPWQRYPGYAVFRHSANRKWFAVVMDVPKCKLGLKGDENLDMVNLKCGEMLACTLIGERGYFPAYHIKKPSWITADLGSVADEELQMLLDVSFQETMPKVRKKRYKE